MPYNTKTTLTFSFELPINLDSKADAKARIKDLISSGNIELKLPTGYKNLNLDGCKIQITGFNSDSKDNLGNEFETVLNSDSSDYERNLQAAQSDLINRISNANNR